jgi:dTDP-4-dehydrorhamnose reductase
MDAKVLVIGGSGLLGGKMITSLLRESFEVCCTYKETPVSNSGCASFFLDIRDSVRMNNLINELSPDVVIHTASHTNVDDCEVNKAFAEEVNVQGTRNIATACNNFGSKLAYISTDYVFDGKRGMYKEVDETIPVNYYGETKLEGEKIVKMLCKDHIIARTSVLYGWGPKQNFTSWVIRELSLGRKINIVSDQYNSPTLADDLADILIGLLEKEETGIFHTAGSDRINRLEFTKKIIKTFALNKDLLKEVGSDEMTWVAKRPNDSSLDVSKVSKIKRPLGIDESLDWMKKQQRHVFKSM